MNRTFYLKNDDKKSKFDYIMWNLESSKILGFNKQINWSFLDTPIHENIPVAHSGKFRDILYLLRFLKMIGGLREH